MKQYIYKYVANCTK